MPRATCPLCEDNLMWYNHYVCPRCWKATGELAAGVHYLDRWTVIEITEEEIEALARMRAARLERHELEEEKKSLEEQVEQYTTRLKYIEERALDGLIQSMTRSRASDLSLPDVVEHVDDLVGKLAAILVAAGDPEDHGGPSIEEGEQALDRVAEELRNMFWQRKE